MPDEPSSIEPRGIPPRTQDLPLWLIAVVLVLCLVVGAAGVWWYFAANHGPHIITISEPQGVRVPQEGSDEGSLDEPPPLPVADIPATLVSFELKSASPHAAFAALADASKMRITLRGSSSNWQPKPFSAVYKNQPFWTVFLDLSTRTHAWPVTSYSESPVISLAGDDDAFQAPHVIHGPFMLYLNQLQHTWRAGLGDRPGEQSLRGSMKLFWEPTLTPLGIDVDAIVTDATDDQGHSLLQPVKHVYFTAPRQPWQQDIDLRLQASSRPGRGIARLAGYCRAVVGGKQQTTFEIPSPLDASPKRTVIDGFPVEFKSMKKVNNRYEVQFEVQGAFKDPRVSRRFTAEAVQLLDEKGKAFRRSRGGFRSNNRDRYTLLASFSATPAGGPPAKLVLTVPTQLQEVRIPFDFKNLPLP